eukprot:2195313-Lingulodinium_polyedra.AAC.1
MRPRGNGRLCLRSLAACSFAQPRVKLAVCNYVELTPRGPTQRGPARPDPRYERYKRNAER